MVFLGFRFAACGPENGPFLRSPRGAKFGSPLTDALGSKLVCLFALGGSPLHRFRNSFPGSRNVLL